MKSSKLISLAIAMLFFKVVIAQERIITGIVTDGKYPLPGVFIKNGNIGTQTDFDGKYAIKAKENDILIFSYIGYETAKIEVKKENVINVTLSPSSVELESVVITAYGKKAKKNKTTLSYSTTVATPNSWNSNSLKYETDKRAIDKNRDKSIGYIVNTNDEDYAALIENSFESPKVAPLSTFSIDVDNASYTNIRRFINYGQKVPKDAVRVEEMVNFFTYNYPKPTGKHPFAIYTEYSDCPWNSENKLLKIGLQGKEILSNNLPASNLVFLIDVSGSMNEKNKLPLVKQSIKALVSQLREDDKVAIVVYAGAAGLVLPTTSGKNKSTIIDALEKLSAGGSTAGGAGIELAYKTAEENFIKGGNNRVILATDGDFNVGSSSDNDMQKLIEEKRKSGVFLTCLGYGMGNYKDSKLETLANKGNGNYAYIDTMQEANRFLVKEFKGSMFAIAKDVKIQIEFNPNLVKAYRLIGYENRKLRAEDFKDDTIDAGELGSGHTVTALYEITPIEVKNKFFIEPNDLKYTQENTKNNFSDELASIKFRYKQPDGNHSLELSEIINNKVIALEKTSADFKLATAVAWFGLKLRESKLISNTNITDILTLAKQAQTNDTEGYKGELVRLIEAVK